MATPATFEPWALDEAVGERYLTPYGPFHVALLHERRFDLLERNARFMRGETFQRLVANVGKDGALAGAVFAWRRSESPQRLLTLSGNHRVSAARTAGTRLILVVYTEADLTRDDQVAIQLSHNALVGEDDLAVLKELWEEIGELASKEYAGLDDRTLGELAKVNLDGLGDVQLDYRTVTFTFLPHELDRATAAFDQAVRTLNLRGALLARIGDYQRLLDDLARAQSSHNVRNAAVGLMLVLDVFERHLDDLAEGWVDDAGEPRHKGWVPLESILGDTELPAPAAAVVRRAVEVLIGRGDVKGSERWRAIELLAAEFLAG